MIEAHAQAMGGDRGPDVWRSWRRAQIAQSWLDRGVVAYGARQSGRVERGCGSLCTVKNNREKGTMKILRFLVSFLKAAGQQVFGSGNDRVWRAYTRTGKIVVIKDNRVLDVIDPKKVPDMTKVPNVQ